MKERIVVIKSFAFAIRIVEQDKMLTEKKKEFVMSKQMLRSGTLIGANVKEAHNAESKLDFIHKMGMAQKETAEVIYWLELLKATPYLASDDFNSLNAM